MNNDQISMEITSDYSRSDRKAQLYVNEKSLAQDVERFWRSIKTKKLVGMSVSFRKIDLCDSDTDMYDTPRIIIKRGLKRARIAEDSHGNIPKDWSFDMSFLFNDTSTIGPILEVIKAALGSKLSEKAEKQLRKDLRPLLQKKAKYANFESEEEEQRQTMRNYW